MPSSPIAPLRLAYGVPIASGGLVISRGRRPARPEPHDVLLHGAATSHRIAVSAVDAEGDVVVAFVLRDGPGVAVGEDWNAMGQRATASGTTTLRDAPIGDGLLLPYGTAYTDPSLGGPDPSRGASAARPAPDAGRPPDDGAEPASHATPRRP